MITPTNAPTFKVWPVRVNADCEGKTSKIAGHFTSREEAVTFCASDECRRLDEYGQEGWLCDPIDVRGLAPAAAPVGCIGADPRCPCQDGDPCNYRDHNGTKAMSLPASPADAGGGEG